MVEMSQKFQITVVNNAYAKTILCICIVPALALWINTVDQKLEEPVVVISELPQSMKVGRSTT